MTCRNCGTELLPGKQFCHVCGTRVERACPSCGARVEDGFRFCPDCGTEVGAVSPSESLSRLSETMPETLVRKIRDSRGAIEGERKQVTVLFCDLAGSTALADGLDPEEFRELLERYLALAIHEVYRFEGIVNQLAGDGLMALFGAPVAHEDAPQRAVWAALAIRDALEHFNQELRAERGLSLPARIGINTGPVVVGTVGNDLKMDYTAIGDTTNLAARLESLATPGTVLVSETTARLVQGFFHMQPVGPLQVKGKSGPVRACEVLETKAEASPMVVAAERGLTPFVGRSEELAQLESSFERIHGLLPQVVAVVGAAGSGKSRLLYEFRERLAGENVVLLEGRCAALQQNVPYDPFVSMLRQFFGLAAGDSSERACRRISEKVGVAPERLDAEYPLLCRLFSLRGQRLAELPPDQLRRETFDAVTRLVIGQSRRAPVLMVIEDLQWIDEPSREMLEMAISRLARARVMLLVSHRPDYRPAWSTTATLTRIHLRPLPDEHVAEILRAAAAGELPADLERSLSSKAEGSPFFAEEIVRSLIEDGSLVRDEHGRCRLTRPLEDVPIPGTVQEVLAARLDRLSPAAKRVVQVAAVFGRQFDRGRLEEVLSEEGVDVDRELAELFQRGIVHRKSLFSDDEFRFGESLTQEVAYEGLLLRQRRQLHERIGGVLEAAGGDLSPQLLAHHFAHGETHEKAIALLLRAARDAEQLPSYRTALEAYRRAWELVEGEIEAGKADQGRYETALVEATLGYLRVTVLYASSTDPMAERAAERGRAVAERTGDAGSLVTFHTMLGMLLSSQSERFAEGLGMVERGLALAEQAGSELQVISVSRALASNYLLDGRFDDAQEKIDSVVRRLEQLGHREQLSDIYVASRWMREGFRFHRDDLEGALRGMAETFELGVRASNRTIQSNSATVLSNTHFLRGEYAAARDWAERGLEIGQEIDNESAIHRAAGLGFAARVELGERIGTARDLDLMEDGLRLAGNLLFSIGPIVEALCAVGDLKRAERFASTAYARGAGRLRRMFALAALGEARLRLGPGHWDDAERAFREAARLAEAIGSRSTAAIASLGLGELTMLRGDFAGGRKRIEAALAASREIGLHRYRNRAERLLADVPAAAASA